MPLYEYDCPSCGVIEEIRKFSDPPLKRCPHCRKPIKKKLSAPALHFKGEGWWVTDYGWKSKQKGAKDGETKSAKDSSSETKPKNSTAAKKDS